MLFFPSADRVGACDGTDTAFPESLFLLDDKFNVLGMRRADNYTGPDVAQGDAFFARFCTSGMEMTALRRTMNCVNDTSLLMWAGNRPVLMICAFYGMTQTLLAVVPEGPVHQLLSYPAGYENQLGALLGTTVTFSLTAMSRRHPPTPEGRNMICDWLKRVHMPFFYKEILDREYDAAVAVLGVRLMQLALLCGCRISFSFDNLSYEHKDLRNLELAIPTLLSVFLAARRFDPHQTIEILGWDHIGTTSTMCATSFNVGDPKDPLREFEPLRRLAQLHDRLFSVVHDPERPQHVQCSFLTHIPDFSVQGIKQPDVRKLYSESAKAPEVYAIPGISDSEDPEEFQKIRDSIEFRDLPPELSK